MRSYKNKIIIFLLIVIGMNLLTGCWNYNETNELALAMGLAIDEGSNGNYKITAEIAVPQSDSQGNKIISENFSAEGKTVLDAIRNMVDKTGKRVFGGQIRVIIISDKIAKKGLTPVLDLLSRDSELREDMWILMAKDCEAGDVLKTITGINKVASLNINDILKSQRSLSKYKQVPLWQFLNDLTNRNVAAVLPTISIDLSNGKSMIKIDGSAVFYNDKYIYWLSGEQTEDMLWVRGELQEGLYIVKKFSPYNENVALELFENRTKLTPSIKNGKIHMDIDVYNNVGIAEVMGDKDILDDKGIRDLTVQATKDIKRELYQSVEENQKVHSSDVYDFSGSIERKYPAVWKKIKKDWAKYYKNIDVSINVKLKIRGSALRSKPLVKED